MQSTRVSARSLLVVLLATGSVLASVPPDAVKHLKRSPLVGTATAGEVISAVKTAIPGIGELHVPFRGWFHAGTGQNLERNGATPDFPVDLTAADENAGTDPQLEKALDVLRK